MEQIVANLSGKTRRVTRHSREYLVAPMTLIVPGVLNGSNGPLYYPLDELTKTASAWNDMPIVVQHPNGGSGRQPSVLDASKVGRVYNATTNGKLKAEGWFDVEALRRVDTRVLAALDAGQPMELSTGLYTDNEEAEEGANHNGTAYTHVARNYRPDHLAILPDSLGACSIKDGCGLLVNQDPTTAQRFRDTCKQFSDAVLGLFVEPHTNKTKGARPPVTNKKEPVMTDAERKTMVDYIVANCDYCEEADRETLNALSDERLKAQHDAMKKAEQAELVANAARKEFTDPQGTVHTWNEEKQAWDSKPKEDKPVANKDDKPALTADQKEDLAFARQVREERRAEAVAKITANETNKLTQEQLDAMPLEALQAVAESIPSKQSKQPAANYAGAVTPANPTANAEKKFASFGLPHEYLPQDKA